MGMWDFVGFVFDYVGFVLGMACIGCEVLLGVGFWEFGVKSRSGIILCNV